MGGLVVVIGGGCGQLSLLLGDIICSDNNSTVDAYSIR